MNVNTKSKALFVLGSWTLSVVLLSPTQYLLIYYSSESSAGDGTALSIFMHFLIMGGIWFVVPVAQWIVLRKFFPKAILWLIATTLGWAIARIIGQIMFSIIAYPVPGSSEVVSSIIVGATIGIAQWLYLRMHISGATWWIVFSALGFLIVLLGERLIEILVLIVALIRYPISPGTLF
jgi:hypothetical protein